MKKRSRKIAAAVMGAVMLAGHIVPAYADTDLSEVDLTEMETIQTTEGEAISDNEISLRTYKTKAYNNPISSEVFCADPTSVEYNGRLYIFGTNDHQQYEEKGADEDNTYEKIKSLVVFSTDDMVNYVYHGEINVGEIAPWITNSWAPSIVSRVEDDGLTHFYLYFSNNGLGVGVITATDPLGPWSDPLGEPLVSGNTPGLENCPNPFDPGVVIDENGDGWLTFGGGKAASGTAYMPKSSKIVKLGDDMLSFDSAITDIPAPYFFEASELNYINGTYVYTYNTDWSDHSEQWDYDCDVPGQCSMVYMTTKTPLDPDSWEMKGEYFKNPGLSGFDYSNNHTHLQKYNGSYYILYHTLMLKSQMGINGGYRSLCADEINVDEDSVTIEKIGGTKSGVDAASYIDPYAAQSGALLHNTADITVDVSDMAEPLAVSGAAGAWTAVKNVLFTEPENASEDASSEDAEPVLTAIETITYNLRVTGVDEPTSITMYPSAKTGEEFSASVEVSEAGTYAITCKTGDVLQMQNMGYFRAADDAKITFVVESIVINEQYTFDIAAELTNTRDWADGLKNIWNGFSDGDEVYAASGAVFRYVGSDDAIELFVLPQSSGNSQSDAPLTDAPLAFFAQVKGSGRIEVRLDAPDGALLLSIDFDSADDFTVVYNNETASVGGVHDLYFVFSDEDIALRYWQFDLADGGQISDSSQEASESASDDETQTSENETEDQAESETSSDADNAAVSERKPDTGMIAGVIGAVIVLAAAGAGIVLVKRKR